MSKDDSFDIMEVFTELDKFLNNLSERYNSKSICSALSMIITDSFLFNYKGNIGWKKGLYAHIGACVQRVDPSRFCARCGNDFDEGEYKDQSICSYCSYQAEKERNKHA